jgi:hypothetical protein
VNAPIPTSTPLTIRAQLLDVDDDGRRALLHQRVITATPVHPRAVVADLYAVALRPTRGEANRADTSKGNHSPPAVVSDNRRQSELVPPRSRELARFRFDPRAGLAFALLTGDANPVHWAGAYARAAGFATPILHGFAMMASAYEGLGRSLFAGATDPIRVLDVRFKRPLVLGRGREVGLYQDDADEDGFYVADAPGVRAYLVGHFERRKKGEHHA